MKKTVSVFGSSRPAESDPEYKLAHDVGKQLAHAGFTVCNGGYGGAMEASARGAKEAGGSTIGVTCEFFSRHANQWIDQTICVPTLVERLMKLVELGDAYVILKGGTGTLLELAAVWEFINKNVIREKPIVLVGNFWKGVVETLGEELQQEGATARFIHNVSTAEKCAEFLKKELK